ncbi:hypothetical protein [Streptomyces sp. 6N106]|uniref:hypothetical protein n=1 Tax=Streptomyces sp. 6N106 TaxID=3457418 RepID=UPI003FCF9556
MAVPNNLLSVNTESVETDLSGWVASGGSFAYGGGSLRPADPDFGVHHISMIPATPGTPTYATTASRVPVTAGTEYAAYGWYYDEGRTGETYGISVLWYNAAGTLISSTDRTDTTKIVDGNTQRITVVGTAPAGATQASVRLMATLPTTTARGRWDVMYLGPALNPAANLLTYTEYSQEMGLGPWVAEGATLDRFGDPVYLTPPPGGDNYVDGPWYLRVTPTIHDVIPVALDRLVPVTPDQYYRISSTILAYDSDNGTPSISYRQAMEWYDASESLVGTTPSGAFNEGDDVGLWDAMLLDTVYRAPADAAFAKPIFQIWHTPSTTTEFYLLDRLDVRVGEPSYEIATDNDAGMISVEIFSQPQWGTTGTYSLRRVDEDGNAYPVRGYVGDLVDVPFDQSPIYVEDYEAPLGQSVWYRVDWRPPTGIDKAWQFTTSVPSPVLPDSDHVWLKSPGLPALNRQVVMETAPVWKRHARSAAYPIVGRRNPVNVTEVRGGRTGDLSLLVLDWDTNAGLDKLLDPGLPVLIQAMPGNGLDGNLYLSLGDSTVEQVSGRPDLPGWRWSLAVTEIDRPSGGVQGSATSTWQTVFDAYATWDDVFPLDSWADVLTGEE